MSSDVPNVSELLAVDPDIELFVGTPNTPARQSVHSMIRDVHNLQIGWTEGEHSSLQFSTFKHSPGNHLLQGDVEIIARFWDPRVQKWLEPEDSRFVILDAEDDLADDSNKITYTCIQTTWLLEKVRVRTTGYVNYASRLNRDYDRAKERYEDAERDYEQEIRELERLGRRIQKGHWPNDSHGPIFAQKSVNWLIRDRKARYRSLAYSAASGKINWYSYQKQGWVWIKMNTGSTSLQQDKADFRSQGPKVIAARDKMNKARSAYASAERAARETSRGGTRYFYNRTPGRLLWQLWREGWERDTGFVGHNDGEGTWNSPHEQGTRILKGLWRHWTSTRDCRGKLWTQTTPRQNWELRLGQSFWSVMQDFRDKGILDWKVAGPADGGGGRSLNLAPYGSFDVDQTRRVALRLGQDVTEAIQTVGRGHHQSVTFVHDGTGLNRYTHWNRGNSNTQTPWGQWEGAIDEPDATNLATSMSLTAQERSERSRRFWIDASRRINIRPNAPIPMLDYAPRHTVAVYDHEGSMEPRKITQIVLEKRNADEPIVATIRFGIRRVMRPVKYARTMSKILGGTDHIQGHILMDPRLEPSEVPSDALYAPAIADIGTRVRFNDAGRPRVVVTASLVAHDLPEPDDAASFEASEEAEQYYTDEEYEGV